MVTIDETSGSPAMNGSLQPPESASEELAKVSSLVLTARRLVAGGALVDLSALEDRVRTVCECVQRMPLEEGHGLLDEFNALMSRLDSLAGDLEERLAQIPRSADEE
jgi:hypothetical protein